jgi:hypothetical protein
MPVLGRLIAFIATTLFTFITGLVGAVWAVRIIAATTLAGIYLACVVFYTQKVTEWLSMLFLTQYGQLLGLLFPPVSGSIVAGMVAYYTCIVGKRYIGTLMKLAVG